jgi:hypothetical protein
MRHLRNQLHCRRAITMMITKPWVIRDDNSLRDFGVVPDTLRGGRIMIILTHSGACHVPHAHRPERLGATSRPD